MIPIGTPIAIVAESKEQVDEAFMRLARVGHETVAGFILIGDFDGPTRVVEQVSVEDTAARMKDGGVQLIDVRRPAEHASGHAAGALNLPLDRLERELDRLDPSLPTYVICQSGYRSSLGASVLENAGFERILNVTGGTQAWLNAGLESEISATACSMQ